MLKQQPIILMYHGISDVRQSLPPERDVGAELYDVTVERFEEQMAWLSRQGYRAVLDPSTAGDKDVVITFDDGELSNYTLARPILEKYGFHAYFFIIAKRVGRNGYMTFDQLKEMHRREMVIGSHGFSHEILTNLADTQIEEELSASKKHLERNLGFSVETLSVPRGFCNDKVIHLAYEAGYRKVFISDRPKSMEAHCFSRVAVKSRWSLKRFQQAMTGHVPFGEKVGDAIKGCAKLLLRERGYNFIRNTMVHLTRGRTAS